MKFYLFRWRKSEDEEHFLFPHPFLQKSNGLSLTPYKVVLTVKEDDSRRLGVLLRSDYTVFVEVVMTGQVTSACQSVR